MRYAMAVDTKKCVGCTDCVVACQTENNVPIGYCRDWIVEVTDGTYPQLEIEIRSERCNHCENAPCVRCCPTGASHYSEVAPCWLKNSIALAVGPVLPHALTMPVFRTPKAMLISALFALTTGLRKEWTRPV